MSHTRAWGIVYSQPGKGIQARLLPSQPLQPRLLIGFAGGRHSVVSNRILGILFSFFGSHVETTCTHIFKIPMPISTI
jgi:hypothetical protein